MGIGKKRWWAALLILLLLVGAGGWAVVQILRVDALTGHTDVVTAVAFTPDGRTLVSASLDDTVRVWDLPTRHLLRTIAGQSSGILEPV